jgi:hypothetical protein
MRRIDRLSAFIAKGRIIGKPVTTIKAKQILPPLLLISHFYALNEIKKVREMMICEAV